MPSRVVRPLGRRSRRFGAPRDHAATIAREGVTRGAGLRRTAAVSLGTMAELKDDINEERRILKEAADVCEKGLGEKDTFPGGRGRVCVFSPPSRLAGTICATPGVYTLYGGAPGGG